MALEQGVASFGNDVVKAPAVTPLYDLPDSAAAVFRLLADSGPATRPSLGSALGLSKPTMSTAIAELVRLELVAEQGEARGSTGRSAVVYSVAPHAGHVLGVELGTTRIRVAAHSLDGTQIAIAEERLSSRRRTVTPTTVSTAHEVLHRVRGEVSDAHGPLRGVVIAAPTLPTHAPNQPRRPEGVENVVEALELPDGVDTMLENNVNCAALAEHRLGVARGRQSFVYLQVGVKIGAGVMVNGRLLPGARGAAGEVAMMPYPWGPGATPTRAGLEDYIGSRALMDRVTERWPGSAGPVPRHALALFELAAAGNKTAQGFVTEHARDIGLLVAATLSVLDPELIVLGGGVGQNPLVLREVRRAVHELAWDTEICIGELADHATLLGTVHLAIQRALDRMV